MNTFLSWEDVRKQEESFGVRLQNALNQLGIVDTCKELSICHACVRIKSPDNVTELKENVSHVGKIISSAIVNGRDTYYSARRSSYHWQLVSEWN
jgi:predicted metalloenzyme YecM